MDNKIRIAPEKTVEFIAFEKEVKTIAHESYYNIVPHQIIIDLIEKAEELINNIESFKDNSVLDTDSTGAYLYELSCLLEVIDRRNIVCVQYLKGLENAFRKWGVFYKEYIKE